MNFDEAMDVLFMFEGGYVDDPRDPGGETNMGISKRAYPDEDIKNLTKDHAKQLFYADYWVPAHCDDLPDPLRYCVFDFAVNSGVSRALKMLQKILGVSQDGVFGPKTLNAVRECDAVQSAIHFNTARVAYVSHLSNFEVFRGGVLSRINYITKRFLHGI